MKQIITRKEKQIEALIYLLIKVRMYSKEEFEKTYPNYKYEVTLFFVIL